MNVDEAHGSRYRYSNMETQLNRRRRRHEHRCSLTFTNCTFDRSSVFGNVDNSQNNVHNDGNNGLGHHQRPGFGSPSFQSSAPTAVSPASTVSGNTDGDDNEVQVVSPPGKKIVMIEIGDDDTVSESGQIMTKVSTPGGVTEFKFTPDSTKDELVPTRLEFDRLVEENRMLRMKIRRMEKSYMYDDSDVSSSRERRRLNY